MILSIVQGGFWRLCASWVVSAFSGEKSKMTPHTRAMYVAAGVATAAVLDAAREIKQAPVDYEALMNSFNSFTHGVERAKAQRLQSHYPSPGATPGSLEDYS